MTKKQLRSIRNAMGLTQAAFAAELKMSRNSVARMETGGMIITPPMALLISFVAREAGVESADSKRGRGQVKAQRKVAGKPKGDPVRSHGSRSRKNLLPR